MKCPKCGRENVPGAPFCADCGKALYAHDAKTDTTPEAAPEPAQTPVPAEVVVEIATPLETAVAVEAAAPAESVASAAPVISDGTIRIAPMSANGDIQPEAEPIPDPEPAAKFEEAFVSESPAEVQAEAVADAVGTAEAADVASEPAAVEAPAAPVVPASAAVPKAPSPEDAVAAVAAEAAQVQSQTQPQAAAQPNAQAQSQTQTTPVPEQAPFVSANGTPIIPPNPARAHQDYPQQSNEALYKKGCLGAAWDDIIQSKNWFGKMCLLGLVELVPILNFYVQGYAMRWSRELFLGKVNPMPEHIFGNRMFVNGFFSVVLTLVIGLISGVFSAIFGFIPLLGGLCALAITLFLFIFQSVAVLRIAIADRLGAGFDVTQIWNACKKNFGALCCATLVPYVIVLAIVFVVMMAFLMILGMPIMGAAISAAAYGSATYIEGLVASLFAMVPILLIMTYVLSVVGVFMSLLIYRAVGHYVTRYAQEWKNEAAVMSTAYIND